MNLEKYGSIIEGEENLLEHATEYYAELFGPGQEFDIQIDSNIWGNLPQLSEDENVMWGRPYERRRCARDVRRGARGGSSNSSLTCFLLFRRVGFLLLEEFVSFY